MKAYAIGLLKDVNVNESIAEYLRRIDATLEPYGGRFLVHGDPPEVKEGEWPWDVIVIEFPDRDSARRWYHSDAYRSIVHLRTDNSDGLAILIDGVDADHRATDILSGVAAQA